MDLTIVLHLLIGEYCKLEFYKNKNTINAFYFGLIADLTSHRLVFDVGFAHFIEQASVLGLQVTRYL